MHLVITVGPLVEKITFNYSFSVLGAQRSIDAWSLSNLHDHLIIDTNSSLANFNVLPLFTMEQMGYGMGLYRRMADMIRTLRTRLPSTSVVFRHTRLPHNTNMITRYGYCVKCFYFVDWIFIRHGTPSHDECIVCFCKRS